jgi:hypothetical protein
MTDDLEEVSILFELRNNLLYETMHKRINDTFVNDAEYQVLFKISNKITSKFKKTKAENK